MPDCRKKLIFSSKQALECLEDREIKNAAFSYQEESKQGSHTIFIQFQGLVVVVVGHFHVLDPSHRVSNVSCSLVNEKVVRIV
jgi:hypothetical protein